jgi:hypothetical protein
VTPLDGNAKPRPKSAQLARGARRYRRKVASPKQWQAISAAKLGPCRVCCDPGRNGSAFGLIQLHHLVSRQDGGDDVADNIVPLCPKCHEKVTARGLVFSGGLYVPIGEVLLAMLTDAEYAYMIQRGGEQYAERAYGIRYSR